LVTGTIPINLDAILIRVTQIKRIAHAMITGAIERNAGGDSTAVTRRRAKPAIGW
jgi:hypothetical protein